MLTMDIIKTESGNEAWVQEIFSVWSHLLIAITPRFTQTWWNPINRSF